MISPESIQQVLNRSDIVDVVGQFVRLKKRGANYIGNCPFHNEKTPSFNVNPSRGIFKCFGCGKGGDVVTFVEEYEKFSFVEAIRWLANYYQIELDETEAPEEYKQQHQIEESLRIVNEYAANYFHAILNDTDEGQLIGGSYFKERGFRQEIINQFRLGYSPDRWDAFLNDATAKGYNQAILEKAGLIKMRDGKVYDSYKGRVIFPIFSPTGRVLGFGARILKKSEHAPKYVNSPENALYVKNKVLYGLYQSRQSIGKLDECFLVEGYTDVISLHQAGVTNVVASSGTSLTEGQLKLIANLTKNLTILYDGDAAGIKAALRGLDMALADSFNVKLVLLPEGEDPDSFVQKQGSTAFQQFVKEHKRDVIGFRMEVGMKEVGGDPIKKSQLVNEIAETISKINKAEDFTLQDYYIKESVRKLQIDEAGMVNLVNKFIRDRVQQEQRQQERKAAATHNAPPTDEPNWYMDEATGETIIGNSAKAAAVPESKEDWQLVKILLEYGDKSYREEGSVAQVFFETIDVDLLETALAKQMVAAYHAEWTRTGELPPLKFFTGNADRTIRQKTADLLQEPYVPSENWQQKHRIEVPHGADIYIEEVDSTFAYFELKLLRRLLQENMEQMQREQDIAKIAVLMKSHQSLKQREKELMAIVIVK
ncbi:MAG: DNA primase [Edaphocola sp.]